MTSSPSSPKRIGLLGGSFNPIHNAHLAAADQAVAEYGLELVIFMPCGVPPHKSLTGLAPGEDRYLMTVAAVASEPKYIVSRYELDKAEPSFTVDTMRFMKTEYPEAELFLIVGEDSVRDFSAWRDPEQLFKLGTVLSAPRVGLPDHGGDIFGKLVRRLNMPVYEISATDIRNRIRDGLPVDRMLPTGVLEYIRKQGLYKQG
jgi:nicotinate-nucleotide adenylyltransferase